MISFVDNRKILEALNELPGHHDDSGVIMLNKQSGGVPSVLQVICKDALEEISILGRPLHIMINRLPPGCVVPVHTDTVIGDPIRWHLPLKTNRHCFFWDEVNAFRFLNVHQWYEVDYHVKHTIGNFGTEERVHLVVDIER